MDGGVVAEPLKLPVARVERDGREHRVSSGVGPLFVAEAAAEFGIGVQQANTMDDPVPPEFWMVPIARRGAIEVWGDRQVGDSRRRRVRRASFIHLWPP
jgi:hypothetical protein